MTPASIRYKNPGAMWGRTGKRPSAEKEVATNAPIPLRWGSKTTFYLSDGLGQGNNIAVFPTYVQGICAQLDLWRSSPRYRNKKFADAIAVWAGGNNVPSYIAYVKARVPGMTEDTVMNDTFWRSPLGVGFLKAQAGHEAGQTYPAEPDDWTEAQRKVFSTVSSATIVTTKKTGAVAAPSVVTGTVAQQAAAGGASWVQIAVILAVGAVVAGVAWWLIHRKNQDPKIVSQGA